MLPLQLECVRGCARQASCRAPGRPRRGGPLARLLLLLRGRARRRGREVVLQGRLGGHRVRLGLVGLLLLLLLLLLVLLDGGQVLLVEQLLLRVAAADRHGGQLAVQLADVLVVLLVAGNRFGRGHVELGLLLALLAASAKLQTGATSAGGHAAHVAPHQRGHRVHRVAAGWRRAHLGRPSGGGQVVERLLLGGQVEGQRDELLEAEHGRAQLLVGVGGRLGRVAGRREARGSDERVEHLVEVERVEARLAWWGGGERVAARAAGGRLQAGGRGHGARVLLRAGRLQLRLGSRRGCGRVRAVGLGGGGEHGRGGGASGGRRLAARAGARLGLLLHHGLRACCGGCGGGGPQRVREVARLRLGLGLLLLLLLRGRCARARRPARELVGGAAPARGRGCGRRVRRIVGVGGHGLRAGGVGGRVDGLLVGGGGGHVGQLLVLLLLLLLLLLGLLLLLLALLGSLELAAGARLLLLGARRRLGPLAAVEQFLEHLADAALGARPRLRLRLRLRLGRRHRSAGQRVLLERLLLLLVVAGRRAVP